MYEPFPYFPTGRSQLAPAQSVMRLCNEKEIRKYFTCACGRRGGSNRTFTVGKSSGSFVWLPKNCAPHIIKQEKIKATLRIDCEFMISPNHTHLNFFCCDTKQISINKRWVLRSELTCFWRHRVVQTWGVMVNINPLPPPKNKTNPLFSKQINAVSKYISNEFESLKQVQ